MTHALVPAEHVNYEYAAKSLHFKPLSKTQLELKLEMRLELRLKLQHATLRISLCSVLFSVLILLD